MALNLYKQCLDFEKFATDVVVSKVSLVENEDPVLKQISDKKSFEDRVDIAKEHFELLGEGSSRTVFKMNDELILKVAHNDKGLAQNKVEMELDLQKDCVATVVVADPEGKWLIAHFTDNMKKEDFKEIVGFGFDSFMNSLFYAYNNESDNWPEPREYDEIRKHPLFECLGKMVVDGSLLIGDLDKPSSYGIKNGRIYLRDYGFSKEVHDKYYSDGTSSSKSRSDAKTTHTEE